MLEYHDPLVLRAVTKEHSEIAIDNQRKIEPTVLFSKPTVEKIIPKTKNKALSRR